MHTTISISTLDQVIVAASTVRSLVSIPVIVEVARFGRGSVNRLAFVGVRWVKSWPLLKNPRRIGSNWGLSLEIVVGHNRKDDQVWVGLGSIL